MLWGSTSWVDQCMYMAVFLRTSIDQSLYIFLDDRLITFWEITQEGRATWWATDRTIRTSSTIAERPGRRYTSTARRSNAAPGTERITAAPIPTPTSSPEQLWAVQTRMTTTWTVGVIGRAARRVSTTTPLWWVCSLVWLPETSVQTPFLVRTSCHRSRFLSFTFSGSLLYAVMARTLGEKVFCQVCGSVGLSHLSKDCAVKTCPLGALPLL